jgi:predicted transcriptional regulator
VQTLAEGVHAVPIVDTAGKIIRLITQADIIRYIAAHVDELGPLGTMTITELGLAAKGGDDLVVARFSDKTVDVLNAMRLKHAPAAPVVDNYGAMVANLSFSDVKVCVDACCTGGCPAPALTLALRGRSRPCSSPA